MARGERRIAARSSIIFDGSVVVYSNRTEDRRTIMLKILTIALSVISISIVACHYVPPAGEPAILPTSSKATIDPTDDDHSVEEKAPTMRRLSFESDLLPIFEAECRPCHFPGGKMHDRLPFDRAETIIENSDKILGRIDDESDRGIILEFVQARREGQQTHRPK